MPRVTQAKFNLPKITVTCDNIQLMVESINSVRYRKELTAPSTFHCIKNTPENIVYSVERNFKNKFTEHLLNTLIPPKIKHLLTDKTKTEITVQDKSIVMQTTTGKNTISVITILDLNVDHITITGNATIILPGKNPVFKPIIGALSKQIINEYKKLHKYEQDYIAKKNSS